MSKINEAAKKAEDKNEGRISGVVSQSISWAYPQVDNDVWQYSFPVLNLNVDKKYKELETKTKGKKSSLSLVLRNLSNLHISVWHWAKPHSYQVLKLKQYLLQVVNHKFLCWNLRYAHSEGQGVLRSFNTFWELESTDVSLWPCSSHLQWNCQLKKVIHTLLPQKWLSSCYYDLSGISMHKSTTITT